MAYFSPLCESITISFQCPNCGEEVVSDSLFVPSPNFAAENNSDSMNYEVEEVICDNCGHECNVTIYNAMYGGEVEVEGVDNVSVDEEYAEDESDYENYVFDLTPEQISTVLDEVDRLSVLSKEFLYRQLFAGTITSMEAFLSSTLIRAVLSSEENKRKFVEKYLPYRDEQISFSSIYQRMEKMDVTIQDTLRSLMYHNLGKIKPIYKDVLDIDLGDISEIMKAVQIRHDIVHRSGIDNDGNLHSISRDDVIKLVESVSSLMSRVSSNLPLAPDSAEDPFVAAGKELPFD